MATKKTSKITDVINKINNTEVAGDYLLSTTVEPEFEMVNPLEGEPVIDLDTPADVEVFVKDENQVEIFDGAHLSKKDSIADAVQTFKKKNIGKVQEQVGNSLHAVGVDPRNLFNPDRPYDSITNIGSGATLFPMASKLIRGRAEKPPGIKNKI